MKIEIIGLKVFTKRLKACISLSARQACLLAKAGFIKP